MILKSLKLVNYRQHADRCVEFDGSLIGVLGPNGSGKSHVFDALHFLFAGRVASQNKSAMLSWGAEAGSAEVTFVHGGEEGRIYREIHSNKASFQFRGETHTGIKTVNQKITECLGIDPDICKQAIFVRQKEVDAVLFTEPSIRQAAWQRLCGLADASKVHAKLGQLISALPEVTDYAEQLDDGAKRIEELQAELVQAKENLELTASGDQPAVEDLTAKLRSLERLNSLITAGIQATAELNEQHTSQAAAESAYAEASLQLKELPEDARELYDAAAAAANECVVAWQKRQKIQELEGTLQACNSSLQELGDRPYTEEELAKLDERVKDAFTVAADWRSKATMSQQLMDAVSGKSQDQFCPLCGQDLTGKDIEEIAKTSLETAKARLEETKLAWAKLTELQKQRVTEQGQWDRATQDLASRTKEILEQLAAYGVEEERAKLTALTVEDVHAAQAQASSQLAVLQSRIKATERLSASETTLKTTQDARARIQARVDGLFGEVKQLLKDAQVANPDNVNEQIVAVETKITQARDTQVEIARLQGFTSEAENNLAKLQAAVEELKAKKKEQAKLFEVTGLLTNVRNWFHYSQGPQTAINSLLQTITDDVNDFLARFGASFYVIPDPGTMSFRFCYHDGRPMPEGYPTVDELSGGEAIILAVSFRFATYCLFAGRVGLLSLDEPTAYLDDHNVSCFCSLLERVKKVAAGMNLQVLISTHEQSVVPFLDTVVQCGNSQTPNQKGEQDE